jgi:DNA processing protein
MNTNSLLHLLALQKAPNLGDTTAKKLIAVVGSVEGVFKEKRQNLLKIDGIGEHRIKGLFDVSLFDAAETELEFIKANNITTQSYMDSEYPERLKQCADGPILLFQRGAINLNNRHIISIVGTRKVTTQGISFCNEFIEALSPLNPIIVSGFAYGVDITAQKAAVKHQLQTIGCLAHGLNQIYPKVHSKYVSQIEDNGGFITDFWSSDTFDRNNFLKRNRIIAGLSEATIVIESAEKGGSLVTADIANSYDREVFAVPGRPKDTQSVGCNTLIKKQQAHVLTSAADLIYMLNWDINEKSKTVQKSLFVELDDTEKTIYKYLQEQGKEHIDLIALGCNMPSYKIASVLLSMEMKGVIRPLPGKLFEVF